MSHPFENGRLTNGGVIISQEEKGSSIYHCMLMEINKQDIFHYAEDKMTPIQTLIHYKNICEKSGFSITQLVRIIELSKQIIARA